MNYKCNRPTEQYVVTERLYDIVERGVLRIDTRSTSRFMVGRFSFCWQV
jgi:hypothetical protein